MNKSQEIFNDGILMFLASNLFLSLRSKFYENNTFETRVYKLQSNGVQNGQEHLPGMVKGERTYILG